MQKLVFFWFTVAALTAFLLFARYMTEALAGEDAAGQIELVNAEGLSFHLQTVEGEEKGAFYLFLPAGFGEAAVHLPAGWSLSVGGQTFEDGQTAAWTEEAAPLSVRGRGGALLLDGTLTVYRAEGIGSLYLNVRRGTLSAVHADEEKKTSLRAVYETRDADGGLDCRGTCTLRGHGNLTWRVATEKKPYGLTLDQAAPLFSKGSQSKWALLSNYFDDTLLMNRLAFATARELGCPYTPEEELVNLYIDGRYRGVYQLVQRVGAEGGTFERDGTDPAWLAEFDWYGPEANAVGFDTKLRYVAVRYPKNAAGSTLEAIRSEAEEAEALLLARDEGYAGRLSVPSFVRQFLMEEVYFEKDVDFSSQFIYRLREDEKIHAGPAWDFDQLLGTMNWTLDYGGLETQCLWIPGMTRGGEVGSGWLKELYAIPSFREAVRACYAEEFDRILTDMIGTNLPAWARELAPSAAMDRARSGRDDASFRRGVERALGWLQKRQEFLSALWSRGEEFAVVTFVTHDYEDNGHDLLYHIRPGEALDSLPGADGITGWQDEDGQPVEVGRIVTEDMTVLPCIFSSPP